VTCAGIAGLLAGLGMSLLPLHRTDAQTNPPLAPLNEDVIKLATVFILQTYQSGTQPVISCVGSEHWSAQGQSRPMPHRPAQ
jgi:hypothetical protein